MTASPFDPPSRQSPGADPQALDPQALDPEAVDRRNIAEGQSMIARGLLDRDQAGRALELARRDQLPLTQAAIRLGFVQDPVGQASVVAGPPSAASFESARPVRPEPGLTLGEFELVRKLGQGGMGVVFLARAGLTEVAIKFLTESVTPDVLLRFEREAEAAAAVDRHPNVVHIHRIVHTAAGPAMVLDYVEGESFDVTLQREGPLSEERALQVALPVVQALGHVHRNGIVHRDLKPANVLIRASDEAPLLGDFGLARVLDAETLTRTGEVLGTPRSMAPEQVTGKELDARADIWAIGVLLYESITGRAPFSGETVVQLCQAICQSRPRPPSELAPELSPAVEAVILRCLEKNPNDRPGSAAELETMLRSALAGQGPVRPAGRSGPAIGFALAALIMIGLAAAVTLRGGAFTDEGADGRAWLNQLGRLPPSDKTRNLIARFLIAPVAGAPSPRPFAEQKMLRGVLVNKLARNAALKPTLTSEQHRDLNQHVILLRLEGGEERPGLAGLVDAEVLEVAGLLAGDDVEALRGRLPSQRAALAELIRLRVAALELAAGHLDAAREQILAGDAADTGAADPESAGGRLLLELLAKRIIAGPEKEAHSLLTRLAQGAILKSLVKARESAGVQAFRSAILARFSDLEQQRHRAAEALLALDHRLESLRSTSKEAATLLPKSPRGRLLTLALQARSHDTNTSDMDELKTAFRSCRAVVRLDPSFQLPKSYPRRFVVESLKFNTDFIGFTTESVMRFYLDASRLGVYFEDMNHERIATMVPEVRRLLVSHGDDPYLNFWLARSMPTVSRASDEDAHETQLKRSLELLDLSLASEDINEVWRGVILTYRVKRIADRVLLEVLREPTREREALISKLVSDAAASLRELEQMTLLMPEMLPSNRVELTVQLQQRSAELMKVLRPSTAAPLTALANDEARARALTVSLGWSPVEREALFFNIDRNIGAIVSVPDSEGPSPERRGERLAFALSRLVQPPMLQRHWDAVRKRERIGHVAARWPHDRALFDLLPIPTVTFEAIEEGILGNLVRVNLELDRVRAAERLLFETSRWAGAMRRQRSRYQVFFHWQTRSLMKRGLPAPTLVISIADRLRIVRRAGVLEGGDLNSDKADKADRDQAEALKQSYLTDVGWLEKALRDQDGAVRRYLAAETIAEASPAELLWLWVEKTWPPSRVRKEAKAKGAAGGAASSTLAEACEQLLMAEALVRDHMTDPAARRVADRVYWSLTRFGRKAARDELAARWAPVADSPEFLHLRCEGVYRAIGGGDFKVAEARLMALFKDHGPCPELRGVSGSFVDQCARNNLDEAFERGLAVYKSQLDMSSKAGVKSYWSIVFKRGDYLIRNRRDAEAAAILERHKDQAGNPLYRKLAEKVRDPEGWRRQVEENRRRLERMRRGR